MELDVSITNKKTINYFKTLENRFNEIHKFRYNYNKSILRGATSKLEIICKVHGPFHMSPEVHLRGANCPKCSHEDISNKNTKSIEEIILRASIIHNDKYDYSLMIHPTPTKKVDIICPYHGIFAQNIYSHLSGNGCPACHLKVPYNFEEFLDKSKEIHGNKYIYSFTTIDFNEKVVITCPTHGEFKQLIYNHIVKKQGCPKCAVNCKSNTEEFIIKSKQIHNEVYDYSLVNYTRWDKKVVIICPVHGKFEQVPNSHLGGSGCRACGVVKASETTSYNRYKDKKTKLYYVKITTSVGYFWKIGLTRKSVESRFRKEIKEGLIINKILELDFDDGWEAFQTEQAILLDTTKYGIEKYESPICDGWTEIRRVCFRDKILKYIKENNEKNK